MSNHNVNVKSIISFPFSGGYDGVYTNLSLYDFYALDVVTNSSLKNTYQFPVEIGDSVSFSDSVPFASSISNEDIIEVIVYPNNVGKFSGVITENQTPVSRLVHLHLSSTGELVGKTVSSAIDGSYTIETPFEGEHYVVAFDNVAGDVYNAVIQDKLSAQDI